MAARRGPVPSGPRYERDLGMVASRRLRVLGLYYPGDEYTDWIGTGALNYGPIAYWSRWWRFDEIFGQKYAQMAKFRKPIIIAELGSLGVGGERAGWYRTALDEIATHEPSVLAVVLFNKKDDQTVTSQKIDWTITGGSAVANTVAAAIRRLARPAR